MGFRYPSPGPAKRGCEHPSVGVAPDKLGQAIIPVRAPDGAQPSGSEDRRVGRDLKLDQLVAEFFQASREAVFISPGRQGHGAGDAHVLERLNQIGSKPAGGG